MRKIPVILLCLVMSGCGSLPSAEPSIPPAPTVAVTPVSVPSVDPALHGCDDPALSPALRANCGRHHYAVSGIVNPSGDPNCGLKDTDGWGGIDIGWLNEWTLPLGGDAYALFRGERFEAGCYSAVITYSQSGFEAVYNSPDCTTACGFLATLNDIP